MTTAVSALLSIGADAFDNIFDVEIKFPESFFPKTMFSKAQDLQTMCRIRCTSFSPPKLSLKKVSMNYLNYRIMKSVAEEEGDRTFDISFRLDANYDIYKALLDWKARTIVPHLQYTASSLPKSSATNPVTMPSVEVISLAQVVTLPAVLSTPLKDSFSTQDLAIWTFENVWVVSLSDPVYGLGKGDSIDIKGTFAFGSYEDPWYHWLEGPITMQDGTTAKV